MGNRNKAKGTAFETSVLRYLRPYFSRAYRTSTKGKYDTGDINGVSNGPKQAIFQCKNQQTFKLSEWLNATVEQSEQEEVAPALPVLVVKRPGVGDSNIGNTYAVLRLSDLVSLLGDAGYE
jgi:hypothetical protein